VTMLHVVSYAGLLFSSQPNIQSVFDLTIICLFTAVKNYTMCSLKMLSSF